MKLKYLIPIYGLYLLLKGESFRSNNFWVGLIEFFVFAYQYVAILSSIYGTIFLFIWLRTMYDWISILAGFAIGLFMIVFIVGMSIGIYVISKTRFPEKEFWED